MKVLYQKFWTVNDVRANKNHLFIYGDNDWHVGEKGQAIIRNEPNAMGIPTKKIPSMSKGSFYMDDELDKNQDKIDNAINKIIIELSKYEAVVFPQDGLGTGLSKLDKCAPLTFKYLNDKLDVLKQTIINNM
jgi:hypothetical protein